MLDPKLAHYTALGVLLQQVEVFCAAFDRATEAARGSGVPDHDPLTLQLASEITAKLALLAQRSAGAREAFGIAASAGMLRGQDVPFDSALRPGSG